MPPKKTKRCKKQSGGWFYEQSDPIFGNSNKWIAKQAGYLHDDLKKSKRLSNAVKELGYGRHKPCCKYGQHGGNSPFMLTNNSSFNSIKI